MTVDTTAPTPGSEAQAVPERSDSDHQPLLEVRDLEVTFKTDNGELRAVEGANLTVYPGQTVAIVGESGSGKSTTVHALIDLLPGTGKVTGGTIRFGGRDITHLSKREAQELRGREIGLVPQDPMSNLNPVWRVGYQVKEALRANNVDVSRAQRAAMVDGLSADTTSMSDDDLYVDREARVAMMAAVAAIGEANVAKVEFKTEEEAEAARESAAALSADADKRIQLGATTRAEAAEILADLGVPNADELAALVKGADADDRVAGLLSEAGLNDAAERARQYPHQYSGGMRQRALIAIGLAARPKLLIADEPTSALDVTVQRRILDHLEKLTQELGVAVLLVTHDLGLAAERAEHLVVMYQGKVVESGPARQILAAPKHPYTQRLVSSAPSLASRRIQSAKARGEEAQDLLAPTGGDGVASSRDDILVVENLTKVFTSRGPRPGQRTHFTAVDDVSFTLKRGTTLALVGESGSGKSTVANMVLDLFPPSAGRVLYDGEPVIGLNRKQSLAFRRRVQPVFQNPYGSLDPMFSIHRAIEEPLKIHGIGNHASRIARVRELLEMVALPASMARRFPNELSGGQRQRIAIARALALQPELIVLDEAVSALDVLVQAQILSLLNDLQAELGLSYLFITHDLAVVRQTADMVAVMQAGKLVEYDTTDEVFDHPREAYTQELLAAIPGARLSGEALAS